MSAILKIKRFVKPAFLRLTSPIRLPIAKALYASASGPHYCPVCEGRIRRFLPYGEPPRKHALCPLCGSLERHRLDWEFFVRETDLFDGSPKTLLHIAPEPFLTEQFRQIQDLAYVSADIRMPEAMVHMDITNISYPDGHFSVIYCSHVLEHIPNDEDAIAELFRVLSPGGWAVLQVPITSERTYENPEITSPDERKKHFGERSHVRSCGPDYVDRLRSAGFVAQVFDAASLLSVSGCVRMGIQPDRLIFYCEKASTDEGRENQA